MSKDGLICQIYASPRREELYLYVDSKDQLSRVPAGLLRHFGSPRPVMRIWLSAERSLARVDANEVLTNLREQGFFLQLPLKREAYLLDLYRTLVKEYH